MNYYEQEVNVVLDELKSTKNGLSKTEALSRLQNYGKNRLEEKKKQSNFVKFLYQFKDLMIIILLISSLASFVIAYINHESYTDSLIIVAIVILNSILGFVQELKADKSIESLKKMQVTKVKVKRDGVITSVNSNDIVIGDIIVLEAGDIIPADARIISQASLCTDESSLTGESAQVTKTVEVMDNDTPLSERFNMVYSGTSVLYGKCNAVVCATGMNTEIGKIAGSLNQVEDEITPLEEKINEISKVLSIIIVIIIIVMFIVGIIQGIKITSILMLSISLAVAAIPEGLPAVITITLSLGMGTLAKKNAIVRKMSSVETLGCTEIICSDKTGTITQNKMTVRDVYYNNKLYCDDEKIAENMLSLAMVLNNDSTKDGSNYIGDPTEIALLQYTESIYNIDELLTKYKRIDEIPFDSERKMMSTINAFNDTVKIITKGSFDSLIDHCTKILEDGKVTKLTKAKKDELRKIENKESNKAYRNLAFAYKDLDNDYKLSINLEEDLIFIGITAMIDPPREDVKEAIRLCKSAHIKPIMITGDSLETAKAIAKEIGILENEDEAILGNELDKYSDEQLQKVVSKYSVYARVSPMNKVAIVNAWQHNAKVVAMTGDGVNDAPALKNADIGVGMGITGTDVSKGVADIVLADDSFSTIVTAAKEGRRIYDNIRNVLVYLLTGNIAEIIVVFVCMLLGYEIFLPIQLLFINLITDSIPAISLSFENEAPNIMKRKVRKKDSSFFTQFMIGKITVSSILKIVAILGIYFFSIKAYGINIANTMAFFTLSITEMLFAYSCRNLKNNMLGLNVFGNKYLNRSFLALFIIQLVLFTTKVGGLFKIRPLNSVQIIVCLLICVLVFLIDEITKPFLAKRLKD